MIPKDPFAPFADQLEWLNHRYDPGHFLGGTLRPELRLSLGMRGKRTAAVLALGSGVGIIGPSALLVWPLGVPPDPFSLGLGVLNILVARRLWSAAAVQGKADVVEEASRSLRVVAVVGLATSVVVVSIVATVVLIGALTAMVKGQMAIAGVVAVLFAIAALRRAGQL